MANARNLIAQDPTLDLAAILKLEAEKQQLHDDLVKMGTPIVQAQVAARQQQNTFDPMAELELALGQSNEPVVESWQQSEPTPQEQQAGPRDASGRIQSPDWVEAGPGVGARRVDGKLQVSNVKDKDGNFTMDDSWYYRSSQTHGPNATQAPSALASQLGSIMSLPNAEAQLLAFGQLQVSVGQEMARAHADAVAQAEQKMGVPQLRNLLAQNEQVDRNNPAWAMRQVDSPETARVRAQLDNAVIKANSLAETFVRGNPSVAGLQAQLKTAETFLMRSLNKEQQMDQKTALEAMRMAEKTEALRAQYRPVQLRRARMLDSELVGKSDDEVVQLVARGKKAFTPEQDAILRASEGDLLQMALARNTEAAAVLLKEASATTNVPEEVLGRRLKELSYNMDPAVALKSLTDRFPDKKSQEYKANVEPLLAYARGEVKDKEAQSFARARIFNNALNGLHMRNTQEWVNNVNSWAWPTNDQGESRIKAVVEAVSEIQGGTQVSLNDVIGHIRSKYPRSEWKALSQELKQGIRANKKEGLLTAVDAEAAVQQAELEFTRGVMSDIVRTITMAPRSDTWYPGNPNNPTLGLGQAYQFLFGGPLDQNK